jgi:hypothetical protein
MKTCIDCQKELPFVRVARKDDTLYECDHPECDQKVCARHFRSLHTLGDFCSEHAEQVKQSVQM